MAKKVSKTSKAETAYGETLKNAIPYSFEYEELQAGDAIPLDEQLSEKDILSVVNQARVAKARTAALNKALEAAGIQKPTLENPAFQLATMIKVFVAAGHTPDSAEQMARTALNMPAPVAA